MKCIGKLAYEQQSQVFSDYLISQSIDNQVDLGDDGYEIWVHDEDKFENAKLELDLFLINPQDQKYLSAIKTAKKIRHDEHQKNKQRDRLHMKLNFSMGGRLPMPVATKSIIILCVILALMTNFGDNIKSPIFRFLVYDDVSLNFFRIKSGQFWRIFTPILLHGGIIHILFNMLWLKDLGSIVEHKKGTLHFLIIILIIAGVSNTVQYIASGPMFLGMSGVVYGLLGYIYVKMKTQAYEGFHIDQGTFIFMMIWFFLCMTPLIGNIANYVHAGGLITGAVLGYLPLLVRKKK